MHRSFASHVERDATVGPASDEPRGDGAACYGEDDQQDDEHCHGAVLAALPVLPGEGFHHVLEEARGVARGLPRVVGLSERVPAGDRDVPEVAFAVRLGQAVRPDAEAAADDGQDDDEIAKLEHHIAPLHRQPLPGDCDHGEDGHVHPREATGGHDETAPDDEARPPTDDLALGQVRSRCVRVPRADPEVEQEQPEQEKFVHFSSPLCYFRARSSWHSCPVGWKIWKRL